MPPKNKRMSKKEIEEFIDKLKETRSTHPQDIFYADKDCWRILLLDNDNGKVFYYNYILEDEDHCIFVLRQLYERPEADVQARIQFYRSGAKRWKNAY